MATNLKKSQKMPKNAPKTPFFAHFRPFFGLFSQNFVATFIFKSGQLATFSGQKWPFSTSIFARGQIKVATGQIFETKVASKNEQI